MARKSKKRGNGEGSIIQRKDGRWMGSITVGRDTNGKLIRKCIYGKTRKEVQDKMVQVASELSKGNYIEPSKILLKDWLDNWIKNYKAIKLKPSTLELYETLIQKVINPEVGEMKLMDLKPVHIQSFYNKLYNDGNGYSTSTIQKVNNILKPAFKQAIKNELMIKNPAEDAELPKHSEKKVEALTVEEQKRFLETSRNDKRNRYHEAFEIALNTGLRCGELLALTWDDIDLKNGNINVNKTIVAITDKETKKQKIIVQETPKTSKSIRAIPLRQKDIKMLLELKLKRQSLSNIVFCTSKGTYVYPKNFRRAFQCLLANAGIKKCGVHVLRHTFATRLFEAGADAKTVSELLGHTNVAFTLNTYTHVMPNKKQETINLLDKISI